MARYFLNYNCSIIIMFIFFCILKCCQCFNPKLLNVTKNSQSYASNWSPAGATWYGPPNGAGSTGGACGFRDTVGQYPYSSMISAGGPSIYDMDKGCGVCYEVKCTEKENEACSGNAVTVTITDSCPGCTDQAARFDLSGTAFGNLAKPGLANQLRNAGVLGLQYRMVKCDYSGVTVAVRVDQGSNPYYFAASIEYVEGNGIVKVELRTKSSSEWLSMDQVSGATWAAKTGDVLQPPFSIKLTENDSGRTLILNNIIPLGWQPGRTYRSNVNFEN